MGSWFNHNNATHFLYFYTAYSQYMPAMQVLYLRSKKADLHPFEEFLSVKNRGKIRGLFFTLKELTWLENVLN